MKTLRRWSPKHRAKMEVWREERERDKGLFIPIRLVSEANQREHWIKKHARNRMQKKAVWLTLMSAKPSFHTIGATFTLTRHGNKMDTDNNAGSFKHVQDEIAKWFGINDGDPKYTWVYKQQKAPMGCYGVTILVEAS